MTLTAAHISPIIALAAGILILIMPRLLNYIEMVDAVQPDKSDHDEVVH